MCYIYLSSLLTTNTFRYVLLTGLCHSVTVTQRTPYYLYDWMKHVVDNIWRGVGLNMTSPPTSLNIESSCVSDADDASSSASISGLRSSMSPPVVRLPYECFVFFLRGWPGRLRPSTADWNPRRSWSQPVPSRGGMAVRRLRCLTTSGSLHEAASVSASLRYCAAAR